MSDIRSSRARTVLALLAIGLGVLGVGSVASAFVILRREMAASYSRTTPAAATLWLEDVDDALVQEVRRWPGIASAEARRTLKARVQIGPDEWRDLLLFVIRDYDAVRIDSFTPEQGAWPPRLSEMLLERVALRVAPAQLGDRMAIQLPGGATHELTFVGTVHAPGLAPAWMEHMAYGYITAETAAALGAGSRFDELKLTLTEGGDDKARIRDVVKATTARLANRGRVVERTEIRDPGKHPHATQLETLLFLLQSFGLLALVLSGVLVAGIVSSLLAQQVRQIGVMKALGASTRQVASLYLAMVGLLGVAAAAPALLVATALARLYARFAAQMLNFDIRDASVPVGVLLLEAAVGVLVPLLVAAYPIWRGSRVTVRAALCDYGVSTGRIDTLTNALARIRGLPRAFVYALRNMVRRRGRLALTMATMAGGGMIFLSAINIGAAMDAMVAAKFEAQPYDLQVRLATPQPTPRVMEALRAIDGVTRVEAWGGERVWRARDDGSLGNLFNLIAPPVESTLAGRPEVAEGRWLTLADRDERVFVINQVLAASEPDLHVGDTTMLEIAGQRRPWRLVGIVRERMSPPVAYAPMAAVAAAAGRGRVDETRVAVVATAKRDRAFVARVAREVERRMTAASLPVTMLIELSEFRQAVEDHLLVIARILLAMSLLVVVVGGLGMVSAMSITVLDRTREIAVLRATGATTRDILRLIVIEGIAAGGLSWLVAAVLAAPASAHLSASFGLIFFQAPLLFVISPTGMLAWLALVVAFAVVASAYPALRAARLPVAKALAYE